MYNITTFLNVSVDEKVFVGCLPREEAVRLCLESATSVMHNHVVLFFCWIGMIFPTCFVVAQSRPKHERRLIYLCGLIIQGISFLIASIFI